MLEASVSIVSGVLIWMGIWDLMDLYIVPDTLWGKLLMVLFGMIGLLGTRTLYDKEMLQAMRMSNGLGGRPDSASLLTAARSDVPPAEVAADAAASSISSGSATSTASGFTSIDLQPAGGGGAPAPNPKPKPKPKPNPNPNPNPNPSLAARHEELGALLQHSGRGDGGDPA